MKPEYFEGVTLVTIQRLNQEGEKCDLITLSRATGMGHATILKAIDRLEAKGRLGVTRYKGARSNIYVILDPPKEYDLLSATLHLADRMEEVAPNGR